MTKEQEALIEDCLWLVYRMAKRAKCCLPKRVEYEDVVSAGNVGLVKAALKFDPTLGVPFGAYARLRIRGEILDHLRRLSRLSRYMRGQGMPEPVVMSFDEPTAYDRETLEDDLRDNQPAVEDVAERNDDCEKIIDLFDGRDRQIFEMLYVDGFTQATAGAIVGVSESRICQIHKGLLAKVRRHLGIQGAA